MSRFLACVSKMSEMILIHLVLGVFFIVVCSKCCYSACKVRYANISCLRCYAVYIYCHIILIVLLVLVLVGSSITVINSSDRCWLWLCQLFSVVLTWHAAELMVPSGSLRVVDVPAGEQHVPQSPGGSPGLPDPHGTQQQGGWGKTAGAQHTRHHSLI